MNNYMITYWYAYNEESLRNADSRYFSAVYLDAYGFGNAYEKAMAYCRAKHGIDTKIIITAISNLSATYEISAHYENV